MKYNVYSFLQRAGAQVSVSLVVTAKSVSALTLVQLDNEQELMDYDTQHEAMQRVVEFVVQTGIKKYGAEEVVRWAYPEYTVTLNETEYIEVYNPYRSFEIDLRDVEWELITNWKEGFHDE